MRCTDGFAATHGDITPAEPAAWAPTVIRALCWTAGFGCVALPDCGSWMVVRKREIIAYDRKQDGEGTWTRVPYVLEGGDPFILQAAMTEDGKTDYEFFGVAVQRERPISVLVAWPVLCGPPPPEPARGEKASNVTLAPLPGMTVVENNCTTTSADAVRGAVRPSQDWSKDITSARWVRDTYP